MPAQVRERAMSGEERRYLQDISGGPSNRSGKLKIIAMAAFFYWCFAMFLGVWLVRTAKGLEAGWNIAAADWVIPVAALTAAVFAIVSTVFWIRGRKDSRSLLLADLKAGRVVEENHEFTAALRLREEEYGGLLYFLRAADGAVFVFFDHESQAMAVQGGDPLTSSFKPRARLTMVRAPKTRRVIHKSFSGDPLDAGDPLDPSTDDWPENEEFCDIP